MAFVSKSTPTFSVSGLPNGVKFDSALRRFVGVPTKAGTFSAKVVANAGSSAPAELSVKVRVVALDAWAKGVFNGMVMDDWDIAGVVQSITVSDSGKIDGKIVIGDSVYALSAPSYSSYDEASGTYTASLLCKSDTDIVTNMITVAAESMVTPEGTTSVRGFVDGDSFYAWQNVWSGAEWKNTAAAMSKSPDLKISINLSNTTLAFDQDILFKFGENGTATATCLGRNCTAVLVPDALDPDLYDAYFYFLPRNGETFGFAAWVDFEWNGKMFK